MESETKNRHFEDSLAAFEAACKAAEIDTDVKYGSS